MDSDAVVPRRRWACDACHKRKIQCEKVDQEPACDWCRHHDLSCTFNRVRGRKKKPKAKNKFGQEQSLSHRLEHIEDAIGQIIARHEGSESTQDVPSTLAEAISNEVMAMSPVRLAYPLGSFESSSILSMASHELHSSMSLGKIFHVEVPNILDYDAASDSARRCSDKLLTYPSQSEEGLEFPPLSQVMKVLEQYLNASVRLIHPFLDPVLFDETLALAYGGEESSDDHQSAKACVLAFISVMCYLAGNSSVFSPADCAVYANKSYLMVSSLLESANLVVLQTITMLHLHHIFSGHFQSAVLVHSLASRLIFMLGGHMHTPIDVDETKLSRNKRMSRQLRMLFWQCYIFDKHITLRTGNPPLIPDDYCDLTPLSDGSGSPDDVRHSTDFAFMHDVFPTDLSLSHLKSKTYTALYSAQARGKSDAEVLRTVRELDDELEKWRLAMPAEVRPALSILDKTQVKLHEMTLPPSTRYATMHLEYHHLVITIHQASGRLGPVEERRPQMDGDGLLPREGAVHSSNILSLEASRSTLVYLEATMNGLVAAASWVATLATFYPAVAVKALCISIVADPLSPQAQHDMQLMRSTAALIQSLPLEGLPAHKRTYMRRVGDFVAEMIRLASWAIWSSCWDKDALGEAVLGEAVLGEAVLGEAVLGEDADVSMTT